MTFRKACHASLTGFETHFVQSHQNPGASGHLWCQQNPPASALKVMGRTDVRLKTGFPSNTACLVLKPAVEVNSFIRKRFIFQHSADWCFSAAAKGGSSVPRHSPRAGRFPFPGPSKPNGISSRSLHRICHRLAAASSRFAKAAKQVWKHTLSHRRCLLCAHGNGASRVKREGHHLHLRRELPQPRSPAEIPPPPSLQTGRASNSSPKMLRVYPLKENLPKPCLPPQSTICAGCWQREAWQLRLLSSASPGRPATAALSSGAIWRVRSSGTGEEGETCI